MTEREAPRRAAANLEPEEAEPEEAELVEDAPAMDGATNAPSSRAELIGAPSPAPEVRPSDEDLPVVARLVVEIRSDGSRTIARGGLEDLHQGHRVAIEARGDSPLSLALALAKSLGTLTSGLRASLANKAAQPDGPHGERPRLISRASARAALRGLLDRRRK